MNEEKLIGLKRELKTHGRLAVAFSGGVDSSFLAKVAQEVLGDQVVAITAEAEAFSEGELREAQEFCRLHGIRQLRVKLDWTELDGFSENPPNRCYICKKAIFGRLIQAAADSGFDVIADGTNADDVGDYRPGMQALAELGVRSPLKEAGLTKAEIRGFLKEMGLPEWEKPSCACLASRVPYGEPITAEKLRSVGRVEDALRKLGFLQVRVRHHGAVARIEVQPEERSRFFDLDLMDQVNGIVRENGFTYGALDLGGYQMGSLNRVLKE